MSFLDKLMGGGKLYDCEIVREGITGVLARSPAAYVMPDGTLTAWLNPDDKQLLVNRNAKTNVNGLVEMKVRVAEKCRAAAGEAVKGLAGQKVKVWGIQINNDAQDGKVELFPVDLIAGPVPEEKIPAWVGEIRKNLKDPADSAVHRVLAFTDASSVGKPPKGAETRPVKLAFPYPPPTQVPNQKFAYEIRPSANLKADFQMNDDMLKKALDLFVTVAGQKNDGPGAFVADVFVFWSDETKSIR